MIDERYQNRIEALEQRNERLRRDNEALRRERDSWEAACKNESNANAKLVTDYSATVKQLRAKLEECERDAQRYRWLRDKCDTTRGFLLGMRRERDEWDAEIDAAIAQDNEL